LENVRGTVYNVLGHWYSYIADIYVLLYMYMSGTGDALGVGTLTERYHLRRSR